MLLSVCFGLLMVCVQLPNAPEAEYVAYIATQRQEVQVRDYVPVSDSARAFPDQGARHTHSTITVLPVESRALRCTIGVA